MGHMRGRLLAVVLTAFYYKMAVETADIKVLDMAPDAVDDQYDGCRDQVLKKITSGLLDEELQSSEHFKAAWNANKPACTTLIPGGVMEHTAAMLAYQNGAKGFLKEFNGDVESLGGNSTLYDSKFQFKSLHFLLMDSMKLLNKGKCQTVYWYAETGKYKVQPGSEIRFGMFLEVTPDKALLGELDGGVLFSITSCSTLNLMDTKCNKASEIEMLLSPVEVFKVEAVTDITGDDDEAYKHIILKHSNYSSNNNCYLFPGTGALPDAATTKPDASTLAGVSTQYLGSVVMVLMAVSLFLLTC